MKYFFDTEFIEYPCTIDLISIGIVCEDGREFYAENTEVDWSKASQWVLDNVKTQLLFDGTKTSQAFVNRDDPAAVVVVGSKAQIAECVLGFVTTPVYHGDFVKRSGEHSDTYVDKPEFWAYFADYDWVVFCWLFGAMIDLPKGFPMYCRDLKQYMDDLHVTKDMIPAQQEDGVHNALRDARWVSMVYEELDRRH